VDPEIHQGSGVIKIYPSNTIHTYLITYLFI
jgi:hypothetical protein